MTAQEKLENARNIYVVILAIIFVGAYCYGVLYTNNKPKTELNVAVALLVIPLVGFFLFIVI